MTAATLALVLSQALLLAATLGSRGPAEFLSRFPIGDLFLLTGLGAVLAVFQIARLLFAFSREMENRGRGAVCRAGRSACFVAIRGGSRGRGGDGSSLQCRRWTRCDVFVTKRV